MAIIWDDLELSKSWSNICHPNRDPYVYAVCEYKAEERLGWYDGEEITAERWGRLGKHEGREHTIRTSWASKHTTRTVQCMNGIDGVAGMQYINTAYGRV